MNLRVLCKLLGFLLAPFSLSMLTTVPFAMYYSEWAELGEFVASAGIGLALSGVLYLIGRTAKEDIFRRETLAITGLSWAIAAAIGALPFYFSGTVTTYTDAYFESISGLTTTGSTVLTNIEGAPKSILFWRSFLHFLGGLGIIVLFVAVLPLVGVGARSLFKQEAPGPVPEGLTPRIRDTSVMLFKIYAALNVAEMLILWGAGMSFFDAVNHALATMATGGFSTKNTSILAFGSPLIEWIIVVFMFLAGTNFSLHVEAVRGRFVYFKSTEFRVYLGIVVAASLFYAILLFAHGSTAVSHPGEFNIRDGFFMSLALMTTTGFGTVDFDQWPHAARMVSVVLMFVGGCAGSTAGGMKVIRWVILMKVAMHELARNISPRRVTTLKIDGRKIPRETSHEVLVFFFLYILLFILGSAGIAMLMPEQSLLSSISAAAATLNNIGPGLEAVGATMNYSAQSNAAKWLMSLLMLMGRLELFPILAMLSKTFWTRT